ncbi:MAG: cytochrome c family protein [Alphaproteobacteria bacterium]|nr:cytochrome c family protein [Alphaproteobacteria bacterium]
MPPTPRAVTLAICALVFAAPPAWADGDAAKGERVYNTQCKTCHTLDKGGRHLVGPNMHGLFGRKAGTMEGFKFSEAMIASGIVWDDKTIAEYIKDPKGRIPGNTMAFIGLKRQDQIDDVIAYLKKATQ